MRSRNFLSFSVFNPETDGFFFVHSTENFGFHVNNVARPLNLMTTQRLNYDILIGCKHDLSISEGTSVGFYPEQRMNCKVDYEWTTYLSFDHEWETLLEFVGILKDLYGSKDEEDALKILSIGHKDAFSHRYWKGPVGHWLGFTGQYLCSGCHKICAIVPGMQLSCCSLTCGKMWCQDCITNNIGFCPLNSSWCPEHKRFETVIRSACCKEGWWKFDVDNGVREFLFYSEFGLKYLNDRLRIKIMDFIRVPTKFRSLNDCGTPFQGMLWNKLTSSRWISCYIESHVMPI